MVVSNINTEGFKEWDVNEFKNYELLREQKYLEDLKKSDGSNHKCPICNEEFKIFAPFGDNLFPNSQCPNCGSLERHRALYKYFCNESDIFNKTNISILHFAAEPCLYDIFDNDENIDYIPVDLSKNHYIKEVYFLSSGITEKYREYDNYLKMEVNVEDIPLDNESIDYLIINHVIEHVPNDIKALSEIYRVLKYGGEAFITVPIIGEKTLDDDSINTPELRQEYYNDPTHLRLYGKDFKQLLESVGFEVLVFDNEKYFTKEDAEYYGLHGDLIEEEYELQFICIKR